MHEGPLNLPIVAQLHDFACGPACFESMFRHLLGESRGEMYFAEKLGVFNLGYTSPESIVELAKSYKFQSILIEGATLNEMEVAFKNREVIFITWWDEDAGHYSLVENLTKETITLMDPWLARTGILNKLCLEVFLPLWKLRGAKMIRVRI